MGFLRIQPRVKSLRSSATKTLRRAAGHAEELRRMSEAKTVAAASSDSTKSTCRNVQQFRGGLVFTAQRLLYHSTLGLRVIKKKRMERRRMSEAKTVAAASADSTKSTCDLRTTTLQKCAAVPRRARM